MQHTSFRTHGVLRGFIALCRGEHFTPQVERYTFEMACEAIRQAETKLDMFIAGDYAQAIKSGEYQTSEIYWEANKRIERAVYDAWGFTASQQFANGIVKMPSHTLSRFASSYLRRAYGDISGVPHFDANGNFIRDKTFDLIAPVRTNKLISGLNFYRISELERQAKKAA